MKAIGLGMLLSLPLWVVIAIVVYAIAKLVGVAS